MPSVSPDTTFKKLSLNESDLGTTINLSARAFFAHRIFSLDMVKAIYALSSHQVDWSLPWYSRLIVLAFFALTMAFPALWAGAITPVAISKTVTNTIQLPLYANTSWLWMARGEIPTRNSAEGTFTFDPALDLQGLILNSAASASNRTGGNVTHPKLDGTKYSFINRSYGIGAAIGLTDGAFTDQATAYTYYENGFESSISCIYNLSSAFYLVPAPGQPTGWHVLVYNAEGRLPNTPPDQLLEYAAASIKGDPAIVALSTDASNGQNYIGITTNSDLYIPLNNTQCQVTFTQRNFSVAVDVLRQTISITALDEINWLTNRTIAQKLNEATIKTLSDISSTLSTSLFVNALGSAFMRNIENVQAVHGINGISNLTGIETVLTSMMDDIMVSYTSAQIVLIQDTAPAAVVMTSRAYTLGTLRYIYAITAVNSIVLTVYFIAALHTRGWRVLSKFDPMDIKSVIITTSEGGNHIAKEAHAQHNSCGAKWHADLDDRIVGGICVRLDKNEEGNTALLLSEQRWRSVGTRLAGQGFEDVGTDWSKLPLKDMGQPMGRAWEGD